LKPFKCLVEQCEIEGKSVELRLDPEALSAGATLSQIRAENKALQDRP